MATAFNKVYDSFLAKITDYKILELDYSDVMEMMHGWLKSAAVRQKKIIHDLTMDDLSETFANDLDDLEIELLALGMVLEWLRPQINSVALTSQFIGGKEEKFYAQANHLSALKALFDSVRLEQKKLIRDYGYRHNTYLDGES